MFLFCLQQLLADGKYDRPGSGPARMPELDARYRTLPASWNGAVLLIFAHADDELTILNEVARLRSVNPRQPFHWLIVSDNAKGKVLWGACPDMTKAECRAREAANVARCVGIPAPHFMNLPDGGLANVENLSDLLYQKVRELDSRQKIGAIFSNDSVGLYGHPDHIAVYGAARAAAAKLRISHVTTALPEQYRRRFFGDKYDFQPFAAITHRSLVTERLRPQIVCAYHAYRSQSLTLMVMRDLQTADAFLQRMPVQFFNLAYPRQGKKKP